VPAVDPHGRKTGLFCRDVIMEQALRDMQELAVANAEPPDLLDQRGEVAW